MALLHINLCSNSNAIADDNSNAAQLIEFFFDRVGNTVGKGENAGFQHFPIIFSKGSFLRVVQTQDCVVTG